MTIISTDSRSGRVILHPLGTPPKPREGWTIREVVTIPPGPGDLRWQDEKLVRASDETQIKTEASKRILALCPDWKQRNIIARMVELLPARLAGTLTAEQSEEVAAAEALWAKIKAIRAHSDALESSPDAGPWPE